MPDRKERPTGPAPWTPQPGGDDGPKSPDVKKPNTKELLEKMRRVDPEQSKRYRQRTGQ
ncbi:MAG: ubiquitin-like protein UBact [Verrucomicrobiales bacterium]